MTEGRNDGITKYHTTHIQYSPTFSKRGYKYGFVHMKATYIIMVHVFKIFMHSIDVFPF